jgi:hypothetical protein
MAFSTDRKWATEPAALAPCAYACCLIKLRFFGCASE